MEMNAASCRNPGYTRRNAPGCQGGTVATTCCSNHASVCCSASFVTAVGAARVSTGPPISVIDRGCAASPRAAISETAATTAGAGWHTATTCVSGPMCCRNVITCSM